MNNGSVAARELRGSALDAFLAEVRAGSQTTSRGRLILASTRPRAGSQPGIWRPGSKLKCSGQLPRSEASICKWSFTAAMASAKPRAGSQIQPVSPRSCPRSTVGPA